MSAASPERIAALAAEVKAVPAHAHRDRRAVALRRIRYAQFPQPPGIAGLPAGARTPLPGAWLASEATRGSSIQGALEPGEQAAAAVLGDAGVPGRPRFV